MHISVDEIAVRSSQYSIKADSLRGYRILYISVVHKSGPGFTPFVHTYPKMSGIMSQCISLRHSEDIPGDRIRYQSAVVLHGICLRIMSLQKYLQLAYPDKVCSITDD